MRLEHKAVWDAPSGPEKMLTATTMQQECLQHEEAKLENAL